MPESKEPVLDPAKLLAALRNVYEGEDSHDKENTHINADYLLVSALRALGYGEAMDYYMKQDKWYA